MSWGARARCHQSDPELFFDPSAGAERRAKAVCARCQVRGECLAYAVETRVEFGVWGGLTSRERRRVLRRAASASAPLELAGAGKE